jgi:DNA-binding MarR family transcriptional regulator
MTVQEAEAGACPTSDDRLVLFGLLLETNARLQRQLSAALEGATGLPLPWFDVLLRVQRAQDGFLTMSVLADQTVYSTGGTTRLIDRMVEKGLVERTHCPSDRRSIHVSITPAGKAALDEALVAHIDHIETFFASKLTTGERDQLRATLRKLNGGLPACTGD